TRTGLILPTKFRANGVACPNSPSHRFCHSLRGCRYDECRSARRSARVSVSDELAHLRIDALAPAPTAEDAVMARAFHGEVALAIRRDPVAELVRRRRLPAPGDVVELALDGK